jgi:hypothetical protein
MLNFSVKLGAKQHNGVRNPQPDHYADSGAKRPISRVVVCKAGEIPREQERRDDPRHRSEYAADSHPLPTRRAAIRASNSAACRNNWTSFSLLRNVGFPATRIGTSDARRPATRYRRPLCVLRLWHALLQLRPLVAVPYRTRGIGAEWLGFLLGAGTAVRLLSAPFAGRLADVFGAFRLDLALFAIAAAVASVLYLPAHSFCLLALVN